MGLHNWVGVILAMCAILATTEISVTQVCFLVAVCFLALAFNRRYEVFEWNPSLLFSFVRPSGPAEIDMDAFQIIFFHGLQPGEYTDAHVSAWKTGDGKSIWPKTWLVEEYGDAHVLTVSYNGGVRRNLEGASRMYIIVENLIDDLLSENIGQTSNCPVVLVGQSFGGLVIKQLCVQSLFTLTLYRKSAREKAKLDKFLANVKGIFFYATPHHGSSSIEKLADNSDSPLLEYFKTLSTETELLNFQFQKFCASYPMLIRGLGENLPATSGLFKGKVGVTEASSREGELFNMVEEDHIQICRPKTRITRSFRGLTDLIQNILETEKKRIFVETSLQEEKRALEEAKIREGKILQEEKRTHEEVRIREAIRVQGKMLAIEEARLQHPLSHVATAEHAHIWNPLRETSGPRIREGMTVQEEKRAVDEGQAQKTLNFQRHLAATNHVRIIRPEDGQFKSSVPSGVVRYPRSARQLNDSLFELYKPVGTPSVQVVFVHGFQRGEDYGDAHLSTWTSADGSCIWPQTWLAEEIPGAHIFSVSYYSGLKRGPAAGMADIYCVTEKLISDLIEEDIGQLETCPVLFVGHCVGGLVIKQILVTSEHYNARRSRSPDQKGAKLEKFLASVRGIFCFATPHVASADFFRYTELHPNNSLFQFFNALSVSVARMTEEFRHVRMYTKWRTFAVGESLPTLWGGENVLLVHEASARHDTDDFWIVPADHFEICRPNSKIDTRFRVLKKFLNGIALDVKKEEEENKDKEAVNSQVISRL